MIEFNCTVKDLFRRPNMIDKAVRRLADNGFAEHAVIYARIRDNIYSAMAYASFNMKDYEYDAAVAYLGSRESEEAIAKRFYFTMRTVRRYIRKACEYIGEYFCQVLGIRLLPVDTRSVEVSVPAGTFWEKIDALMGSSIENACIAIVYCNEKMSINYVCNNFGMGSQKVKKIIDAFGTVITVYGIPSEKRSAV